MDCKSGEFYLIPVCVMLIEESQIGIVYVIITTVLFLFPPDLPVTGSNMSMYFCIFSIPNIYISPCICSYMISNSRLLPLLNPSISRALTRPYHTDYCVVVFFIILLVSVFQWFFDGRKNFTGPRIDIDALQNGEVVGMEPSYSEDGSGVGSLGDMPKEVK